MPEPTPQPGISQERCRLLRSKWMFIEAEPDPTVPRSDSGICWCVHTQNCLGTGRGDSQHGELQTGPGLLRTPLTESEPQPFVRRWNYAAARRRSTFRLLGHRIK